MKAEFFAVFFLPTLLTDGQSIRLIIFERNCYKMEENLIFCFSGTGNSLKAAKDVAKSLGDTKIILMKEIYKLSGKYNRIGFIYPSYAGGAPKEVLQYVEKLEIKADMAEYFFTIVTCGGAARNSLPMLREALFQKGISLNYGKELNTVGNYIAMYPPRTDIKETLKLADKEIEVYANEIKEKVIANINESKFKFKLFYKLGNQYFKMNAKKHNISNSCNSCGTCEKICPTKSIKIKNNKPEFTWKTCSQCMACIQWCPKAAVNCGNKTNDRARYHHPDIKPDELV